MPKEHDLIAVMQAAREFGVSLPTLYRYLALGKLTKYERPGGRPRVFVDRREMRVLLEPRPVRKVK